MLAQSIYEKKKKKIFQIKFDNIKNNDKIAKQKEKFYDYKRL